MASVLRTTAVWQGFTGAPGYTNFHWGPGGGSLTEAADSATSAMRAFFEAVKAHLAQPVTVQVLQEVPMFDEATGVLQDVLSATNTPAVTVSSASGTYGAPAGLSIIWTTGEIRGTRRLRGRTYIVPANGASFDSAGTLSTSAMTAVNTAATALRGTVATPFQVWGRPSASLGAGNATNVIGHILRDKVSVLRSRRD